MGLTILTRGKGATWSNLPMSTQGKGTTKAPVVRTFPQPWLLLATDYTRGWFFVFATGWWQARVISHGETSYYYTVRKLVSSVESCR
jgi:hypothetical protein